MVCFSRSVIPSEAEGFFVASCVSKLCRRDACWPHKRDARATFHGESFKVARRDPSTPLRMTARFGR
jgi:hypothetical protein